MQTFCHTQSRATFTHYPIYINISISETLSLPQNPSGHRSNPSFGPTRVFQSPSYNHGKPQIPLFPIHTGFFLSVLCLSPSLSVCVSFQADVETDVAAAGVPKKRTFKKFSFRGVDLDALLDMSTDELVKLFSARARRR